jgi:hypothetical protein
VTSWEKPPVWGVAQQAKYLERANQAPKEKQDAFQANIRH